MAKFLKAFNEKCTSCGVGGTFLGGAFKEQAAIVQTIVMCNTVSITELSNTLKQLDESSNSQDTKTNAMASFLLFHAIGKTLLEYAGAIAKSREKEALFVSAIDGLRECSSELDGSAHFASKAFEVILAKLKTKDSEFDEKVAKNYAHVMVTHKEVMQTIDVKITANAPSKCSPALGGQNFGGAAAGVSPVRIHRAR